MSPSVPESRPRRQRRSTGEIVDRILEAAREEFEENGYVGARTAAIAQRAGVAEALIFSHFGTKAGLFHDAIFTPLDRHFTEFCDTHLLEPDDAAALRAGTREYVGEMQAFVSRHARMLTSLLVEQMYDPGKARGLDKVQGLHAYFARASERAMQREGADARVDPRLLMRVSFATILANVLFRDWLFPSELADDAAIGAAITEFVLDGLNANNVRA